MTLEIPSRLKRQMNTSDAVIVGLSAMIGSGIFVAVGPAVASAGSGILLGIVLAAFVAFCNATSSAQLASLYPESGGTYVYAQKQLGPFWGWLAGWTFVVGKVASCAAAALTFGYYVDPGSAKYLALAAVVGLTALNYFGIQKTIAMSWGIVIVVLLSLLSVVFASVVGGTADVVRITPLAAHGGVVGIFRSAGLMFFAFAGYARIATLGEEVKDPRQTIPKAIVTSLAITVLMYLCVVSSVLLAIGPQMMKDSAAPLVEAVNAGGFWELAYVVRLGAVVAALGVLLSLMLGISRTLFAMAANRDLPRYLSAIHTKYKVPHISEFIVAIVVMIIVSLSDIRSSVGFSAFTILIYYAITNVCALKITKDQRLWPRYLAILGLVFCLLLALCIPLESLAEGVVVILTGTVGYFLRKIFFPK